MSARIHEDLEGYCKQNKLTNNRVCRGDAKLNKNGTYMVHTWYISQILCLARILKSAHH